MKSLLMYVEVIISILLIVVVVAQESKSSGMGAVSGAADSVFGGKQRGLDGLLSKLTVILGTAFFLLSLWLNVYLNTF